MPDLNSVKAFLFDLDGTLIDTVPQLYVAVQFAMESNRLPSVSLEQVRGWIGNGVDVLLCRAMTRHHHYSDIDPDLLAMVKHAFNENYRQGLQSNYSLYPTVYETLQALYKNNYVLAVVTNKPDQFVKPLLHHAGLSHFFSFTLGGGVLKEKKPDPTPLLYTCQQLQIEPQQAIMVGDSKNDILAAQAAHIASVGLTYGYNYGEPISQSHPDWTFDRFEQLAELVLPQ
jgi:phosphoglycolate phosphatase